MSLLEGKWYYRIEGRELESGMHLQSESLDSNVAVFI